MDCAEMKCQVSYSHTSFLFDLREFPKSDGMPRWGYEKRQLLSGSFLLLYVFLYGVYLAITKWWSQGHPSVVLN